MSDMLAKSRIPNRIITFTAESVGPLMARIITPKSPEKEKIMLLFMFDRVGYAFLNMRNIQILKLLQRETIFLNIPYQKAISNIITTFIILIFLKLLLNNPKFFQ